MELSFQASMLLKKITDKKYGERNEKGWPIMIDEVDKMTKKQCELKSKKYKELKLLVQQMDIIMQQIKKMHICNEV